MQASGTKALHPSTAGIVDVTYNVMSWFVQTVTAEKEKVTGHMLDVQSLGTFSASDPEVVRSSTCAEVTR